MSWMSYETQVLGRGPKTVSLFRKQLCELWSLNKMVFILARIC